MGGGSQQTTSSQQNTLPDWLKSAYQGALPQIQGLQGQMSGAEAGAPGLTAQGLSSIGGVNPSSIGAANNALTGVENGAFLGSGLSQMGAANPAIASEASGSLMNPQSNPWLTGEFNQGLQGIQNNVDSQFGAAGRNVLAGAPIQADQASTLANQLYGGQYDANLQATQNAQGLASNNFNTGIGSLLSGASTAPSVTAGQFIPGQTQLQAGQTGYQPLSWYSQLLGNLSAPFGQSSGTQTVKNNPGGLATFGGIMSGIGGLLGGAAAL